MAVNSAAKTLSESKQALSALRDELRAFNWDDFAKKVEEDPDDYNAVTTIVRPIADMFIELTSSDDSLRRLDTTGISHYLSIKFVPSFRQDVLGRIQRLDSLGGPERINSRIGACHDILTAVEGGPLQALTTALVVASQLSNRGALEELDNIRELRRDQEVVHKSLVAIQEQAERSLASTNAAAISHGIFTSSKAISETVSRHRCMAYIWLGLAALFSSIMALCIRTAIIDDAKVPIPKESWLVAGNLHYFAPRILAISLLSFLLVAAVRNYRSERHNQVVNRQRLDALATYSELKSGTQGQVADAIALQATGAIFTPQSTGYGDKEAMPVSHVSDLLNWAKKEGG